MEITFKQCTQADAGTLRALSCKTFQETFAASNPPSQLQAYLDSAYAEEKLRAELGNESSQFYFLYCDGGLAGYLKLNTGAAQTEFHDTASAGPGPTPFSLVTTNRRIISCGGSYDRTRLTAPLEIVTISICTDSSRAAREKTDFKTER